MKKIILSVLVMFLAGHVFCQAPLDKSQQKRVKEIHKSVTKDNDAILKNSAISADEKKDRVDAIKNSRDARLAAILTSEQIAAVKAKDPIDWNKVYNKINKAENSRLKAERDQKLKEVDKQMKDLDSQQDDIKRQMNELKRRQKDLTNQQKALKAKKKEINARYK